MYTKEKIDANINTIKEQIDKFDSKANILIAIVGIVFAVSLSMLEVFRQLTKNGLVGAVKIRYILLLVFTILYFISFAVEMAFLLLVIYPRKKKSSDFKSLSYYMDVDNMTDEELCKRINDDNEMPEIDQLKVNAKICTQKHRFLVKSIWTLIPLFINVLIMFFIAII